MTLIKRIHCVLDREPESYHATMAPPLGVHSLNLNFECELGAPGLPNAADETEAEAAYAQFLQTIGSANAVAFYAYRIVQDGAAWRAELLEPVALHLESEDRSDPRLLLDWLAEHPGRNGHWTVPSQQAGGEALVSITEADARVTHLLRASQFWSAPVAHQFGLTHVVGLPDDAVTCIVLPIPLGETPLDTLAATLPTSDATLWEMLLPSWGDLDDVLYRTNQLQTDPQVMPDFLDSAGYLKVNPDAEYMRRVLDWFERGWAGLMSNGPALLGTLAKADPTRFEPSWTPFPEQAPRTSTLTAPEARWLAMSGLCAGLDPIIVAMTRPASERQAEGQILAAIVTHLLEAFALRPSAHVPQDAAGMTAGLRLFLSNSVLLRKHDPSTPVDPAEMSKALRAVYDIRGGAEKSVATQILDLLLADPKDLAALDEASVRRLAREVSRDAARQPLGFAEDPFDQVLEHVHTLNAERGSEAAIIRVFETAADGASVPDAIWNQLCPAVGPATPEERQEALVTVLGAWQNFLAQLNGSFNGAEAVRRSTSADFAQALVTFYLANNTEGGNVAGEQIVAHAMAADYFATRLLGATATQHCFDEPVGTLPRLQPDGTKLEAAAIEVLRAGLTAFYQEAIAPIATLDPASIRFVADMAPQPLPIQVTAQAGADDLDAFATDFNGIGLAVRRLDRLAGVPDRWTHAQLAEFNLYEAKPAKTDDAAAPLLEGIRQWMPPPPDGRAPIFLDYNGFPLASQAATSAGSDPAAAQLYRRPPVYTADVASPDGFAPVPRLAYGRRFEAFSFATTNAGNLPLALQKSADQPWLPRADFDPSTADVYEASYQRRTAVGSVSIDEAPEARKIGSAIAGVRPLSSD